VAGNTAADARVSSSGNAAPAAGSADIVTFSRIERFASVASTNDVVRAWLAAGVAEICLAVADEQTAGRGRHGRSWQAPAGAALLASLGFRPAWLAADRVWRLPATVALAMCDAAEEAAGLRDGTIRLKWPNDLVVETSGPHAVLIGSGIQDANAVSALDRLRGPIELRKLAGVLGETDGLGTEDPRAIVGIGVNVDWASDDFPPDLAGSMTSLREVSGGRSVELEDLLDAFRDHLEARMRALRAGFFDVATWAERQVTTGHLVELETVAGDPTPTTPIMAIAVDASTGGLVVSDPSGVAGERLIHAGEVRRVRLAASAV
jgi:BirA family biotin operon repressor/biotin-[acetyl-CoA-carboxylase] ligase